MERPKATPPWDSRPRPIYLLTFSGAIEMEDPKKEPPNLPRLLKIMYIRPRTPIVGNMPIFSRAPARTKNRIYTGRLMFATASKALLSPWVDRLISVVPSAMLASISDICWVKAVPEVRRITAIVKTRSSVLSCVFDIKM